MIGSCVGSDLTCGLRCLRHDRCQSYNCLIAKAHNIRDSRLNGETKKSKPENYKKSEDWIHYEPLQVGTIYSDSVWTNEGKELKTPLRVSKRFEDTSNCCLIFVCFFARSPTPCLCVTCRAKLGVHVKISVHVNLDIRGATVKPVGRTGNIKPRVSLFRTPKARERDPGMVWSLFVLTMRQQTKD